MEKQEIKSLVTDLLEWIQKDGIDNSSSEVKNYLKKMENLTDPIKKRAKESELRDDAVKNAYQTI